MKNMSKARMKPKDWEKLNNVIIDTTVRDLIIRDYVRISSPVYNMLPETEFLDELEEEE